MKLKNQINNPIEIFFSYSHKDKDLREELEIHLSALKRQGIIKHWHDREISAGEEWEGKINDHLNSAQIILLLISAHFVASDYCYNRELKRALERHESGEARVIPIIIRPAFWEETPFSKLQALPTGGKPVISWENTDDAFLDIVQGIYKVVKEIQQPIKGDKVNGELEIGERENEKEQNKKLLMVEWVLTLNNPNKYLLEESYKTAILDNLQKLSRDRSLTISKFYKSTGSLYLKGGKKGFERVQSLFDAGILRVVIGFTIKSILLSRRNKQKEVALKAEKKKDAFGYKYDLSNFIYYLNTFPSQISHSLYITQNLSYSRFSSLPSNIVISGVGESSIAGNLLLAYLQEELIIPSYLDRFHSFPQFVNNRTLFIALSYSGNSLDTLKSVEKAIRKSAIVIGISSGGKLEEFCLAKGFTHIKIPAEIPDRQSLAYIFFSLLMLFEKLQIIGSKIDDILETEDLLFEIAERNNPKTSYGNNLANHIAQSLYHAVPAIYTALPALEPVALRWKNQFNQNSKSVSLSGLIPEFNYNEITGWEGLNEINQNFRIVFLRSPEENAKMKETLKIIKEFLRGKRILFGEVFAEGNSRLANLFSLIYCGDWASYYLAMLNEKDPLKSESLKILQAKLRKFDNTNDNKMEP